MQEREQEDPINTLPNDPDPSLSADDLQHVLGETVGKMKLLKDQLQLRLHLASMEAHDLRHDLLDSVEHLSQRFQELSKTFEGSLEKGQVQLHLGLMELKERWDITKEEAQKALTALSGDKQKALQFFQEARLQAKLGQSEAKDLLNEGQEELGKKKSEFSGQLTQALKRINGSVSDFLHQLS